MHIAILYSPGNFHCKHWANALKDAGAKVSVISLEPEKIPGIDCYNLLPKKNGKFRYWDYYFTRKKLRKLLDELKIDILHPMHLTPFGTWARWSKFPKVIGFALGADILEYIPQQNRRHWNALKTKPSLLQRNLQKIKQKYFKKQVQKVLKTSDLVLADNSYLKKMIHHHFDCEDSKVEVLHFGVKKSEFELSEEKKAQSLIKLELSPKSEIILSPRGLKPIYQADIIFQAFQALDISKYPDYQFVMLSSAYSVSEKFARELGNFQSKNPNFKVIFRTLNKSEMAAIWLQTKAFISIPVYDGYSAAVAEGRFAGAIPIVNDIPANEEILQDSENAFFVKNSSVQNLKNILKKVLSLSGKQQKKMRLLNQDWILENSVLEKNAVKFLEICKKIDDD